MRVGDDTFRVAIAAAPPSVEPRVSVTLHAVVALVAVFLQAASAGVMFFIARAPGWERVRLMAAIALTAGVYSAVDVWFYSHVDDLALRAQLVRLNLFVAGVHAAMWMRFTFADASGTIRSMPAWARGITLALLLASAAATAGDFVLDYGRYTHVQVPWLGLDERAYAFNGVGDAVAMATLATIVLSLGGHARRIRRGEPGALGIVIGLSLYALCIVEEALVASGNLVFMYLGSPGYVFAVLPLTIQLLTRFGDDARRLAELSARLSTEVEARTVERDAARDSLVEQQRLAALGRLAAGVGHEINNPLQYVTFQLEELRSLLADGGSAPVRESLAEALDGTRRIAQVVTSLRAYGVRREQFEPVALDAVVRAALRIASPQVRHDATLLSDIGPLPAVRGDEGQLVQMLVNPLVNAAQALAASEAPVRLVVVRAGTGPDGWAEITIADTGPGFDPAVLPRLGEPYVTTRAQSGGTGLGLFVTRGLVDAHGGTFELRNRPGGGAEARLRLPPATGTSSAIGASTVAAPAAQLAAGAAESGDAAVVDAAAVDAAAVEVPVEAASRAAVPSNPSARVLVVDDEPELLAIMQRVLTRLGHRVTVAEDGEAALAVARQARDEGAPFDVVLTDLMMPRLSGADFAERLARELPALRRRLIVMTGGAVTPADEAFLQREDIVVVNKPVGLHDLGVAVARALAAPLLLLVTLASCRAASPGGHVAPPIVAPTPPAMVAAPSPAGADSARRVRLSPATDVLHLTWLPGADRPGPWRAAVLEVRLDACVTLGALKGGRSAVGRTRTSDLLAAVPAARAAVAAVNADFFAFTPAGVPTGAHVEDGRVVSGPGARPVVALDSTGRPHLVRLRAGGWVARAGAPDAERLALHAWNRWPADGLALLDAGWGVPLDSTAARAERVAAVRVGADRARVLAGPPPALARGDTVLLLVTGDGGADGSDAATDDAGSRAAARGWLRALRPGDTIVLRPVLAPVAPRDAVGGFPVLLEDGAVSPSLATDGAAGFRGVNPRTAIGWDLASRRLWLVVVDGRQPDWSIGTTTRETAELLRALGARDALNLDGGGSSAFVVRDAASGAVRVLNRPSDPTGERAVGNALAVYDRCETGR